MRGLRPSASTAAASWEYAEAVPFIDGQRAAQRSHLGEGAQPPGAGIAVASDEHAQLELG